MLAISSCLCDCPVIEFWRLSLRPSNWPSCLLHCSSLLLLIFIDTNSPSSSPFFLSSYFSISSSCFLANLLSLNHPENYFRLEFEAAASCCSFFSAKFFFCSSYDANSFSDSSRLDFVFAMSPLSIGTTEFVVCSPFRMFVPICLSANSDVSCA